MSDINAVRYNMPLFSFENTLVLDEEETQSILIIVRINLLWKLHHLKSGNKNRD